MSKDWRSGLILQRNETVEGTEIEFGEDEELLAAALEAPEGDLRAFEQLVQLHQKRILADCQHLTHDRNNAEDLAQEVFVKAFFGMRSFEGRSSFRHWLQRIKVYHCLNHLKRRKGKETLSLDDAAPERFQQLHVSPNAQKELEAMEERRRIDQILDQMPESLRVPLVMREMDELPYEEIAAALGLGLSAVKMRIKRGREYFRSAYEEGEELAGGTAAR